MLVCDLGARTVSVALCATDGRALRVTSVAVAGGGGRAFDATVAASLPGTSPVGGFSTWFDGARTRHGRRAAVVLPRAWTHPRYREAPVYQIGGTTITAGTLIAAFSSTAATLTDVVTRVLGGSPAPATVAIAGSFGVFPLVSRVLLDELALPEPPRVLGPAAAVRGALRIASAGLSVVEPDRPAVRLPLHRIKHGLMEVREVPLDPSADFAVQDGYPVLVEVPETPAPFSVQVDGQDVTVRLPDLPPGPYRVGLRPSHACPGVLVLAPAAGGAARHYPIDGPLDPPLDREPPR